MAKKLSRISTGAGRDVRRMRVVRRITPGETLDDIINELKRLTFTKDKEYAIVKLASGERAIVTGGRDGIMLPPHRIRRLLLHTHPYSRPATGFPSNEDRDCIAALGQRSSYILEHGVLFKYWVE